MCFRIVEVGDLCFVGLGANFKISQDLLYRRSMYGTFTRTYIWSIFMINVCVQIPTHLVSDMFRTYFFRNDKDELYIQQLKNQ